MLLGAVLVLLVLGGAAPASAHAALRSTDPGDGTVLQRAPRAVTLTFTESVGLRDDSFRVLDPGGHRLHTEDAGHADGRSDTARVTLPGTLGEGTYTVAWRVVSADSHPVSGAFTFSVGKPSATTAAVAAGPTEDPLTAVLHRIARYLAYLAAALLVGTAAFVALCRPPDPAPLRRPLVVGWWTLLAATVALLVLRAPYEAGTGPATALDASALGDTLTSRPGVLLLTRLALLVPTALLLARTSRRPRGPLTTAAGAALAVGLALTWAAAEHAVAGPQVPLAVTSSVLHLLATAVWLGGLVALLTTLRGSPDASTVARFSRVAPACVTVLAVTGVYQSWRGLGSWPALTGTTYGRLLLAKLAGVCVLLAVAAVSRRWTGALVGRAPVPEGERARAAEAPVPEGERARAAEALVPVGASPRTASPPPPSAASPAGPGAGPTGPSPGDEHADAVTAHRRGLRRSVLAEAVVAAVVLVLTTLLTSTLPGRAATEAARSAPAGGVLPASVTTIPFDAGASGGRGTVQITLDPGRTGDNAVQAVVFGPDGSLAAVPELRLSFTLPDREIGPIAAELVDRGGYWSANSLTLPLPGTWTMKATVRVTEVDQVSETRRIRILP
ncbi:copper resistance protein CopC [Streptomyces sp. CL12-4]|uniref:copper resistance CopC/CopD family protein n=1 Tax=Streptomyces sp. CL12-4 TaxID=2810306 RepID=UPI001EFA45B1|nr:copper resistance protein CopC [Streptomyces sp. CL12-4]MCG8970851.1 copper resistance protein CopC/CopD [Streptomyces sp. CL12-4]